MFEWIKKWFSGKPGRGHTFSEEERSMSSIAKKNKAIKRQALEIRKQRLDHMSEKLEMVQLEQQEAMMEEKLQMLTGDQELDELVDDEPPDMEHMMTMALVGKVCGVDMQPMFKQAFNIPDPSPGPTQPNVSADYTDMELQSMLDKVSKEHIALFRQMDADKQTKVLQQMIPNISEGSITRARELIAIQH